MSSRIPLFCLGGAFALIGIAPLAMAVASAPTSGQTAVVFDPRLDRAELMVAIAEADVSLVRFGALPGTVVVDVPEGGFHQLSASGAWLIADPILLGGCEPENSFTSFASGAQTQ